MQYVFTAKAGQILCFLAGGTGIDRALGTNVCLAVLGDGCGGILLKHKTIVTRSLQYVFTAKAGADFGVLADGTGVSGVLGTNVWFMVLGMAAGEYCQNTKLLLCRDCNMFLLPRLDRF